MQITAFVNMLQFHCPQGWARINLMLQIHLRTRKQMKLLFDVREAYLPSLQVSLKRRIPSFLKYFTCSNLRIWNKLPDGLILEQYLVCVLSSASPFSIGEPLSVERMSFLLLLQRSGLVSDGFREEDLLTHPVNLKPNPATCNLWCIQVLIWFLGTFVYVQLARIWVRKRSVNIRVFPWRY